MAAGISEVLYYQKIAATLLLALSAPDYGSTESEEEEDGKD